MLPIVGLNAPLSRVGKKLEPARITENEMAVEYGAGQPARAKVGLRLRGEKYPEALGQCCGAYKKTSSSYWAESHTTSLHVARPLLLRPGVKALRQRPSGYLHNRCSKMQGVQSKTANRKLQSFVIGY
ncbi:hypothetical protein FQN53_007046 [Emmonsiellopsis sp. PD_33]|nr:hypothetical protein FQN53_007046 [Emmonsiellopsis sp. PD_33]